MAKKYNEEEIKAVVQEETDMIDLVGVIKSEMDDAKDFIHQVGAERAESTEYYLGTEPEGTSSMQSEFVSTDVRESVLFMRANGVDQLVEIGNGKVLSGLARRIDGDMASQSISTPKDIETFLKSL